MKIRPILPLIAILALGAGCGPRSSHQTIRNKGSDTLLVVAQAWSGAYMDAHPEVDITVSGGGSGTGIAALIGGTVDIANASREMKPEEIEAARKNGIEPTEHVVGYDALAVFVHKDNPLDKITFEQLAGIYGEGGNVRRWSELGLNMPGNSDEIVRVSRQNNSGTYEYFKETVLGKTGDFAMGSRDLNGTKEVVDLVSTTPGAIGYGGIAYAHDNAEVRMVPVIDRQGQPILPTIDNAVSGAYPIARPLLMYTQGEASGIVKAYLDWIVSDAGQRILVKEGYAPLRPVQ